MQKALALTRCLGDETDRIFRREIIRRTAKLKRPKWSSVRSKLRRYSRKYPNGSTLSEREFAYDLGAINHNGKIPLKVAEKGTKINAGYYQEEILQSVLKPEASRLYPNDDWIFQQDSALAHKAKATQ